MTYITYAWYPFNVNGLSQQKTAEAIHRGLEVMSRLANVRFGYSPNPDFTISGYHSNSWAAAAQQNHIWFSTIRKTTFDWWAYNAMPHEFCHMWGNNKFLAWGHASVNSKTCLMHPNASSTKFMCPSEVIRFIKKYGSLSKRYWPIPPLKAFGDKIRKYKKLHDEKKSEWRKWSELRDQTTGPKHQEYAKKAKAANDLVVKYWAKYVEYNNKYIALYKSWAKAISYMEGRYSMFQFQDEVEKESIIPVDHSDPIICCCDDSNNFSSLADQEYSEITNLKKDRASLDTSKLRPLFE